MECFIDAVDVLEFKPIIPKQALLELLKVNYSSYSGGFHFWK